MTSLPLNRYGDELRPTSGQHGSDIASQRLDTLDAACLETALRFRDRAPIVADLGCGRGAFSVATGAIGAFVWMYDMLDLNDTVEKANALFGERRLTFVRRDLAKVTIDDIPPALDILYSQRTLHYFTFSEATRIVDLFSRRMEPGARAFLSCSGLASELSTGYPHAALPVEQRYSLLASQMADHHQIHEPVCLYTAADLGRLAEAAGLKVLEITHSDFGNVKGKFVKC